MIINLPNSDSMLSADIAGIRCNAPTYCKALDNQYSASVQIKHLNSKLTVIHLPTHAHAQMWSALLNAVWQRRVTL